jgi:hypothetical protein
MYYVYMDGLADDLEDKVEAKGGRRRIRRRRDVETR